MKIYYLLIITLLLTQRGFSQDQETLRHIPKGDDMKAYRYTGDIGGHKIWGFVTGHNLFRDYEWGEKYEIKGKADIYKIISHHGGVTTEKDKKATFKIYNVNSKGLPKDSLGGKEVKYGDLDMTGEPTTTKFDKPIPVEDEFFVTFYVADYAHNPQANDKDTMIVLTSEDESRGDDKVYGRNVVRQHGGVGESGIWTDMATELEYSDLEAYLALFPVVQFEDNSIKENYLSKGGITFHPITVKKSFSKAVLNFELGSPKEITTQILDINGKLISATSFGSLNQGHHSKNIEISNLKAGIYIITLESNGVKLAQSFNISK